MKSTLLALLIAFGALLLVEMGLRLYATQSDEKSASPPSGKSAFLDHPIYGRIWRPGYSAETEGFEKRFVFQINELGLRGPPMSLNKAPGTYRIIFVGASTTENRYLPYEDTFPALVEKKLNERLGGSPRVEVGVLSTGGANSDLVLARIAIRVLELSPDLVIVMSASDWMRSLHPDYDPMMLFLASERTPPQSTISFITDTLLQTQLGQIVWKRRGPPSHAEMVASARAKRRSVPFRDPPNNHFERGLKRYWWDLHRSGVLCRDSGIAFALMTKVWLYKNEQPPEENDALWLSYHNINVRAGQWNVSPPVARKWADHYNDVVRDVARTNDYILINL